MREHAPVERLGHGRDICCCVVVVVVLLTGAGVVVVVCSEVVVRLTGSGPQADNRAALAISTAPTARPRYDNGLIMV
jgi:hypothetical protein